MKTQQINKSEALKRLDQIQNEAKELRKIIEKPIINFDQIKTFEDACDIENIDVVEFTDSCKGLTQDEISYKKLKIIIKAINGDWEPDWNNSNEYKYWPYFNMTSGFGFSDTDYDGWYSTTDVGSRLCFKSRDRAEFAAKNFIQEYKGFICK